MISRSEYYTLNQFKDIFLKFSQGRQVTVTRAMYDVVVPIIKAHFNILIGPITCAYCATQVCRYGHKLWSEYHDYLSNSLKSKSSNNE